MQVERLEISIIGTFGEVHLYVSSSSWCRKSTNCPDQLAKELKSMC